MSKHTNTPVYECDPWLALALGVLGRAKSDAAKGDLGAVAFLLTTGAEVADKIAEGSSETILRFCRGVLADVDTNKVKAKWHIEEPY